MIIMFYVDKFISIAENYDSLTALGVWVNQSLIVLLFGKLSTCSYYKIK